MSRDTILSNLNQSQLAAVTSAHGQLSILAGPGSGKTHTLASRAAWLLSQGLQPCNVIVTTFTVKAAREMKERIGKLVGIQKSSKLILGTFHSITRRYLNQYGQLIGIRNDFGIADSADSLAIIKRIVKRNNFVIDPKVARSRISGIKARGGLQMHKENKSSLPSSIETEELNRCYLEYEDSLYRSNLLDYDDLLLRCVELLRGHPNCVANVEAVLIDEFQDTNIVQFDLMQLFAARRENITVVGDPDQSIYSFRAAEIKNYKRLRSYYPNSITIALEENYRSSGAILLTALCVIEQDAGRIPKTLLPTHAVGTQPVLRRLLDAHKEAQWIATEIQRIIGMTGGMLDLRDFSILLRSAALSRLIEGALGKAGLAYKMVGGSRFYDRIEVRAILDYLRVVNQPENNDALSRIINIPSRRIGDATIRGFLEEADERKITLWSLILGIVQSKFLSKTKVSKQVEQALARFCDIILTGRGKISASNEVQISILDLTKYILKKTKYEEWLEEHHNDHQKIRWSNVMELMTQITEFQDFIGEGGGDESLPLIDGMRQTGETNSLSKFLANVALTSEVQIAENGEIQTPQITISTIHAAKGLEWPVVFIPAAYQGSIPHSRAEDSDEERRLLYVAMTRAKALLYISHPMKNSQGEKTNLTPFLSGSSITSLIVPRGPTIESSVVQSISHILQRPLISSVAISKTSSLLPSLHDNLFLNDQDNDQDLNMRPESLGKELGFETNQPNNKRRRIGLKGPDGMTEEKWLRIQEHNDTKISARTFRPIQSSTSFQGGFVSACSHLVTSQENLTLPLTVNARKLESAISKREKREISPQSRSKKSLAGAQQTLLGFLGKSGPERTRDFVPRKDEESEQIAQRDKQSFGIEDSLSHHRLSATVRFKPRVTHNDKSYHSNYVFLSSSSSKSVEEVPEIHRGLQGPAVNNSRILRHSIAERMPPVSMKQQHSVPGKKTLGIKRSMNGWSTRKEFVPPKPNQKT